MRALLCRLAWGLPGSTPSARSQRLRGTMRVMRRSSILSCLALLFGCSSGRHGPADAATADRHPARRRARYARSRPSSDARRRRRRVRHRLGRTLQHHLGRRLHRGPGLLPRQRRHGAGGPVQRRGQRRVGRALSDRHRLPRGLSLRRSGALREALLRRRRQPLQRRVARRTRGRALHVDPHRRTRPQALRVGLGLRPLRHEQQPLPHGLAALQPPRRHHRVHPLRRRVHPRRRRRAVLR